eukprot:SAG31_NODE_23088_length_511_cov_2.378641_1_plen_83_part_00
MFELLDATKFSTRRCWDFFKLNPRYFGPFEVLAQPGINWYKLKLPNDNDCYIHDTFNAYRLKPFHDPGMVKYTRKVYAETGI